MKIEKLLEKELLTWRLSCEDILAEIDKIRHIVFYPNGTGPSPLGEYQRILKDMLDNGVTDSTVVKRLKKAINNSQVFRGRFLFFL